MNPIAEDILMHYGVKRRSGRYPWGSGDSPYQHSGDFLSRVEELKKDGKTDKEIADEFNLSSTEYRISKRVAKNERRRLDVDHAKSLKKDGLNNSQIGKEMGINESSVRSLLNENSEIRMNRAAKTAEKIKEEVEKKGMVDVGKGVERELGISEPTLQEAVSILELEGYNRYGVGVPQATNSKNKTTMAVLCKPDITYGELYKNRENIQSLDDYHSVDGGSTYNKREYPASVDSKRVHIRYGDEGGRNKDGVIEIRRGVKDLDLGNSHYAQVRILVDGTHYLKGMAMYSDDIPDGSDIVFNTNKKSGTPKMEVLKAIKTEDKDNPFGAYIKANGQSYYDDPKGKYIDPLTGKKQSLSAINKLKEEGDWESMSKNLSSQFLSKQPMPLIKKQLNLTYADKNDEFEEIMALTNPTVKRKMLETFADECDGAALHLKAAALPRQKTQVILPVNSVKETEIYAPNYKNGEQVALIRYPHGGTFEIPVLTVNNKNVGAKKILGSPVDAVGINAKVAERLSGADFDGDQVIVIPTNEKVHILSTPQLDGLKDFDAKNSYPYHEGMKVMSKSYTQKQMGMVSNLITDMTLKGATDDELARAVRHSMVVIDAHKHKLDYVQSAKDNGIAELKQKYQSHIDENGKESTGASTLLSRRKQSVKVPERKGSKRIDETGKVIFKESGRTYIDPISGKTIEATTDSRLISETDDLRTLSSGTQAENAYADYGNKVKALANRARKEALATGKLTYSKEANERYSNEVGSLMAKLNIAAKNAPREREAQRRAYSKVKAMEQENPDMTKKELKEMRKKVGQASIVEARNQVNAKGKETKITLTDKEWEAIQAGAVTDNTLKSILRYTDSNTIKQLATPRTQKELSTAKVNKLKSMYSSGYTFSEIADALGVSTSTVSNYLRKE